jgi:hypothetical protein
MISTVGISSGEGSGGVDDFIAGTLGARGGGGLIGEPAAGR